MDRRLEGGSEPLPAPGLSPRPPDGLCSPSGPDGGSPSSRRGTNHPADSRGVGSARVTGGPARIAALPRVVGARPSLSGGLAGRNPGRVRLGCRRSRSRRGGVAPPARVSIQRSVPPEPLRSPLGAKQRNRLGSRVGSAPAGSGERVPGGLADGGTNQRALPAHRAEDRRRNPTGRRDPFRPAARPHLRPVHPPAGDPLTTSNLPLTG